MYKHDFTPAPEGYTTKKGAPWIKQEAEVQDATTRNKVDVHLRKHNKFQSTSKFILSKSSMIEHEC
jgi:hypothetical protein|tara:strand:+ start:74 stop:271 length:198 start_codon:yes stop_codon:yes gene_type:complete